jgi:hypothetical protein
MAFDGTYMWIVNGVDGGQGSLTVRRVSNGQQALFSPINVGNVFNSRPTGIGFDGKNIWIACNNDGVTVLSATSGALVTTITLGVTSPYGVAFDGANIWVSNQGTDNVSKF